MPSVHTVNARPLQSIGSLSSPYDVAQIVMYGLKAAFGDAKHAIKTSPNWPAPTHARLRDGGGVSLRRILFTSCC